MVSAVKNEHTEAKERHGRAQSHLHSLTENEQKTLLLLLNARSVCNKAAVVRDYIIETNADIIGLTETWLADEGKNRPVIADLVPHGYEIVHIPRPTLGGGVAIIHRSTFKCGPVSSSQAVSFESMSCELCHGTSVVKLAVIYRPHPTATNKFTKAQFFEEFEDFVIRYTLNGVNPIIVGDFNFHVDVDADKDALQLKNILASANLTQHVTDPTHISGHTLDLVITRMADNIVGNTQAHSYLSDHAAVHSILHLSKPPLPVENVTYRKTKSIDHDKFATDLQESSLLKNPANSFDGLVMQYDFVLSDLLEKHAPLKKRVITVRPQAPWHNGNIIDAKKVCRRAERRWRQSNLTIDRCLFQAKRNTLHDLITKSKSDYYCEKIASCQDQKGLFRVIEELLPRGKPKLPSHESNGELAECFNSFFSEKIRTVREALDRANVDDSSTVPSHADIPAMRSFDAATEDEITRVICSAPSKSCPADPLPTWLLKMHIHLLAPTITRIVNMSLDLGEFPASMKKAQVVPLLKKPSLDAEQLKNYRPVSNLTFLSKVIEKIVAARINNHLSTYQLHEPMQSAYRECHGTETALVCVQNDLLRALDQKQAVYLVLLDLSAAFDTIDHNILLDRLQHDIGIQGLALKWVRSYLHDRYQSVTINGESSSVILLSYGVPQGSVLGPKFFTVYSAPVAQICRQHSLNVHMYADDTQLYLAFDLSSIGDDENILSRVEVCIADIKRWMTLNKLKLNEDKTEFLIISTPQQKHKISTHSIDVCDTLVNAVPSARNLGAVFDSSLTMEVHVTSLCQGAYCRLRSINSIRNSLSQQATEILVHAFVSSRLDNSNALLSGLPNRLIQKLQKVQNAAARTVLRLKKYDHISLALKKLHWLPVKQRIQYKIILLTWKALHNEAPLYVRNMLTPYQPTRQLRSGDQMLLQVPRTKLKTYGDRAFSVAAPREWNSLPQEIRLVSGKESFKQRLKTYLFHCAFESLG